MAMNCSIKAQNLIMSAIMVDVINFDLHQKLWEVYFTLKWPQFKIYYQHDLMTQHR